MKKMMILAAIAATGSLWAAQPALDTLICHRGESHDAPENTMPAYKMAVDRGFGFECDIYLSKDKKVFTFHDGNLTRTTAGACTKKCAEASWEDEISKVDVGGWGKWKGSQYSPTRPALLEELLQLARDGRQIYVEVKPGPEIVPYIKDVYKKQTKANEKNTLFISFNKETCSELKEFMPEYKVYWLTDATRGSKKAKTLRGVTAKEVIATLRSIKADGVDIQFDPRYITEAFIKEIRAAGFECHVWTVDKLEKSLLAFNRGAQTVTTNCAQKQLDEYQKGK